MRKLLFVPAFALAACSGGSGSGTTAGVCHSTNQSCAGNADCCAGFSCLGGSCLYTSAANNGGNAGGNNGGNGNSGGGNGGGSSSGGGNTGCLLCGGTTGGGVSSGGSTGGASGGSTTGATTQIYCDGLGASDGLGDTVYLQYYDFSGELTTEGCATAIDGWTDGSAIASVGGIYALDADDNGATPPAPALYLSTCSDVGLAGSPSPASAFTPPASGFTTVAQAVSSQSGTGFWGVVTAVKPWTAGTKSGLLFVQDPVAAGGAPIAGSGIEVYLPEGGTAAVSVSYGTVPALGDVVTISNATWSPYKGANQFAASATTVVSKIGSSPLPPPVPLSGSQVSSTSTVSVDAYADMRVVVSGSFTAQGTSASGNCPAAVTNTVTVP